MTGTPFVFVVLLVCSLTRRTKSSLSSAAVSSITTVRFDCGSTLRLGCSLVAGDADTWFGKVACLTITLGGCWKLSVPPPTPRLKNFSRSLFSGF